MNRKIKIAIVFFCITMMIQTVFIYYDNKSIKHNMNVNTINVNTLSLKHVYNSIGCNNDVQIIDAQKNNYGWNIRLQIKGSRNTIVEKVNNLRNCSINGYTISKKDDENTVILDVLFKK